MSETRISSIVISELRAVPHYKRVVGLLVLLSVATGLVETGALYLIGRMAVAVTDPQQGIEVSLLSGEPRALSFGDAGLIAAVLLAVLMVLSFPIARVSGTICATTLVKHRIQILRAYLGATWARKMQYREGRLQELAGEYCRRREQLLNQILALLVAGTSLVILLLGAVATAPLLTLVCGGAFFVITLPLRPALRSVRVRSSGYADADADLMANVAQTTRVAKEIETFNVGTAVADELAEVTTATGKVLADMRTITKLVPVIFQYAALACVLALLVLVDAADLGQAGAIGAVLLILVRALAYIRQVQAGIQLINEYAPYVDRFDEEIAKLPPRPQESRQDHPTSGSIDLVDVSFGYEGPDEPLVLHRASASVPDGATVAVVGKSGAGKSTLAQLIVGLRQPTGGQLLFGGRPAADLDHRTWSRLVHYVPQDNQLILGTIRSNVVFYRSGYTDADVLTALDATNLLDFVSGLPAGIDTPVGPGQAELSGGQRQRLGIARALLGSPSILVLDEPTSSLDPVSEGLVHDTLRRLKGHVTLIIVAHRQASLDICDYALRVKDGKLEVLGPDQLRSAVVEV